MAPINAVMTESSSKRSRLFGMVRESNYEEAVNIHGFMIELASAGTSFPHSGLTWFIDRVHPLAVGSREAGTCNPLDSQVDEPQTSALIELRDYPLGSSYAS